MRRGLLGLLLWPVLGLPATVTLSWDAPTQNTDGTPLTDLAGYRVYYGTATGEYTEQLDLDNPTLTAYVVEGLADGATYYFAMTARNAAGVESDFSGEAAVTTETAPNPPADLTIGPDLTVYTLVQSRNRIALVAVGTADPGTPCDMRYSANGLYLVPVESVTWAGTVESEVVVGACQ